MSKEFDVILGKRIRDLREGLYTQMGLGEEVGLGRLAIGEIEKGNRKVYAHEAVKFARAFGLSVSDMLEPPPKADMDAFDFILWRLDYNATDMGEIGKYVRWEYIVNFVNEAREKYSEMKDEN